MCQVCFLSIEADIGLGDAEHVGAGVSCLCKQAPASFLFRVIMELMAIYGRAQAAPAR